MSLINYLTRIHFADRVLEDALAEELRGRGVMRPLVLTDEATGADAAERLADALPRGADASWRHLPGGPLAAPQVLAAAAALVETGADAVIGMGGVPAIDAARLLGLADGGPETLQRLLAGGALPVRRRPARCPVLAVPVTAAGGLGLTPGVWIAGEDGQGRTLSGACLIPAALLCDPTLGAEAGPLARAAAGMDALALCIEAYLGTGWNPPADGMALDGIRRAAAHLPRTVRDGRDIDARREVLAAGLNGGLAAQKGLGALTALARPLEAGTGAALPHGSLTAALLPAFLAFNAPAVGHRYPAIAAAMGIIDPAGLGPALASLGTGLGLPGRLDGLGLDGHAMARIAQAAEDEASNRTNPRLACAEDYRRMLEAAA